MGIWNLRAKVAVLWLVLTLLVIGIVAWAISAEVVMEAMRDAARKNTDISSMRLQQNFDNSDDFSINRINKNVGDSRKSGHKNSEFALIREVHNEEINNNDQYGKRKNNNKHKTSQDDKQIGDKYILDEETEADESEESLQTVEVSEAAGAVTTKKPFTLNLDFDKLRQSLTGSQVAQVIDRLMAQRKALNPKESKAPQIVVVAPVVEPTSKKPKISTTSSANKPTKSLTTTSTTTTSTTTSKPLISRTTFKPYNRSRIQSLSLRLLNPAITTTKPKGIQPKVNTIKLRRTTTTTTTTTPFTTTSTKPTTTTTTTKRANVAKKKSRSRKPSSKSSKNSSPKLSTTTTTTTQSPSTTMSPTQLEAIKSKIRQKELQYLLNKVESLEKQQKNFLKLQAKEQDLLMENSFQENVYNKPNIEVIPFKNKYPDFNYGYSQHNHEMNKNNDNSNTNQQQSEGWQPTPMQPPPHPHLPPHLPPPPPPPPPMPNMSPMHPNDHNNNNNNHNMFNSHQMPFQPYPPPPPPPQHQAYAETQDIPHMSNKPMFPMPNNGPQNGQFFNGILPIPNNRAISLGHNGEHHMTQESRPMPYRIKSRGHGMQKTEKPGVQLSFGGGPMGGGGQLKTSPMGIFKTLLLPLLPKPRMNLNGKVVFGVVLENGVGFGKKPKIVAQHFSTGHI